MIECVGGIINNMNLFNKFCGNAANIIYSIVFFLITFIIIFVSHKLEYWFKIEYIWSNALLLICGMFAIVLLYAMAKKFSKFININVITAIKLMCLLTLVFQIILASKIYFITDWDAGTVNYISSALLYGIPLDEWQTTYIGMYPNNLVIAIFEYIIKKIASLFSFNEYFAIIVFGICMVNLSLFYLSKTVYILTQKSTVTYFSYLLALIIYGFSPWIVIPYSDTFTILLPILTIYCYINYKKQLGLNDRVAYIYLTCCFAITMIGYLIKPQVIIVLIAILLAEFLVYTKNNMLKKTVICLCNLVLFLLIATQIKNISYKIVDVKPNKDANYGITHFFMMGLNEQSSGAFSYEDYEYTGSLPTAEEKVKGNIEVAKNRIKEFGLKGLGVHLLKKTSINFNDGSFAFGKEGVFYDKIIPNESISAKFLREVFYTTGQYFISYFTFVHSIWLAIIFFCMLSAKNSKIANDSMFVVRVSLLGLAAFITVFEARARYLFHCLPLFVLCAVISIYGLIDKQYKDR